MPHYMTRPAWRDNMRGRRRSAGEIFDYYASYSTGSDTTGTGTLANPYKTLGKCLTVCGDNKKIGLMGDASIPWREWNIGTKANNGCTIKAVPGYATPTFYNTAAYTSWAKTGGYTNVYETAYTPSVCYGALNGTTNLASVADLTTCDSTPNSYYFDDANNKLYVNIGGGAPTTIEISSVWQNWLILSGTDNVVENLTFSHTFAAGLRWNGARNTLRNCTLQHWRARAPLVAYAADCLIESCTATNNVEITPFATNTGASNLTVRYCNIKAYLLAGGVYGVQFAHGTGHVATHNNIIGGNGVFTTGAGVSSTVSYNIFYNCLHAAIMVVSSATMTAHHNIVYDTEDLGVQNNYGFVIELGATAYLYHNTVANLLTCTSCDRRYAYDLLTATSSVTARNNIAYKCYLGFTGDAAATYDSDYNDAYQNSAGNWSNWPKGAHDLESDPLFVDEGAYNYNLQAGSPCRNAGDYVAGISETGAPVDIGRYEYP